MSAVAVIMAEEEVKEESKGRDKGKESADEVKLRKTISPYDITSNDNPGSLLT